MLEAILEKLVKDALETNEPVQKQLQHGLHLHLRKYEQEPYFMLTIFREGVGPSAQEWNIVIAHWPYPLGAINWSGKGFTKDGKHFMQAKIKTNSIGD